ncbi:MAG: hydrolase, haloacid dehalogenase-like family [Actinomycetia bacterium]|nr:hydrolase, haloacid dehalogenase-like family [Actinomycetes bacterium]
MSRTGPTAIGTVVFDLGGVLVDWDPRHLYRQVLADDDEVERFLAEVCTWEWHTQHDLGRPMAETIPELSTRFPEHAGAIALWHERYHDMVAGEVPGTVEVVRELHAAGTRLLVLSNMPADVLHVLDGFEWLDLFDAVVVSGQEGLIKPDPAIYRILVDRHGVDPATTAFVDDRPENVAAATALGFRGIPFTDAPALRRALS